MTARARSWAGAGDEVEGSASREAGYRAAGNFARECRRFSGCPPGAPSPASFPPGNVADNAARATGRTKPRRVETTTDQGGFHCGIVGYVGPQDATPIILNGLKRLEYRGYDSAGLAVLENGASRSAAKSANYPPGGAAPGVARPRPHRHRTHALGHSRRASSRNAHPHVGNTGQVVWSTTASSRTISSCARS